MERHKVRLSRLFPEQNSGCKLDCRNRILTECNQLGRKDALLHAQKGLQATSNFSLTRNGGFQSK